jgi:lipoprotein-anchoring transpeptidase ErfK/SrfK
MTANARFPAEALRACSRHGVVATRHFLVTNISRQTTTLFDRPLLGAAGRRYKTVKTFRCSTSRFGIGEKAGSNMTPRGLHRIARKIGGGWPAGTAFKSRQVTGFTWSGQPTAPITTRIMWLEGLEPGFNSGEGHDTFARYVYIHGTGDETTMSRPASHGCVHLLASDLIPLYDLLPAGTLVWIAER